MKLPVAADSALLPSLLALSDVMTTGHHGAVTVGVGRGDAVLVVGDGAVGLCAVLAAERLGAAQVATLDTGSSLFFDHHAPEMVTWLAGRRLDS